MGITCRSIPAWFAFLLLSAAFTTLFTALIWTTWRDSAISSTDAVANRLHFFVIEELRTTIETIFDDMLLIINGWAAQGDRQLLAASDEEIGRYCFRVLNRTRLSNSLALARTTGDVCGATRFDTGEIMVFDRPMGSDPSAPADITYYRVDSNLSRVEARMTFHIEVRVRPWYVNAVTAKQAVFTSPYYGLAIQQSVLALSMPVFQPGTDNISAVLCVNYPFDALLSPLQQAYRLLKNSSIIILFNSDNSLIASYPDAAPDVSDVQSMIRDHGFNDGLVVRHRLASFGPSFVLQALLSDGGNSNTSTTGIAWRLVVVLPERDYYSKIDDANHNSAIIFALVYFAFMVAAVCVFWFGLARPLHELGRKLRERPKTSSAPSSPTDQLVSSPMCFLEVSRLSHAVADALVVFEQATAQQQQQLLQQQQQQLAGDDPARSGGMISHLLHREEAFLTELRALLVIEMKNIAELERGLTVDARQRELMNTVQSNQTLALSMLNNFLDFHKIEGGQLSIHPTQFNLDECIEEVKTAIQTKADAKRVNLVFLGKKDNPVHCIGDRARIRQVLIGLLNNAINHTTPKELISLTSTPDGKGSCQFTITNVGESMQDARIIPVLRIIESLGGMILDVELDRGAQPNRLAFRLPLVSEHLRSPQITTNENISPLSAVVVIDSVSERRYALCALVKQLELPCYPCATVEEMVSASMSGAFGRVSAFTTSSSSSSTTSSSNSASASTYSANSTSTRPIVVLMRRSDIAGEVLPDYEVAVLRQSLPNEVSGRTKLLWIWDVPSPPPTAPPAPPVASTSECGTNKPATVSVPQYISEPLSISKLHDGINAVLGI